MKMILRSIDELLNSYQNYYSLQFRLVMNNQSVFRGFDGKANSWVSFQIHHQTMQVECSHADAEKELQVISIALKQLLEMVNAEDIFRQTLEGSVSKMQQAYLENEFDQHHYVLVLIQANTDLYQLKQLVQQISTQKMLVSVIDQQVVVLMNPNEEDMKQFLVSMRDTLEAELYCRVQMAVSESFEQIKELSQQYAEIKYYRSLCSQYDPSCSIADYSSIWMLEMLDLLSEQKAEKLMRVLVKNDVFELDEESITTIHCFLENNLSISAAARALYVHRNTLIYRLDKIAALTGLDIRHFEDALKLRLALILNKK